MRRLSLLAVIGLVTLTGCVSAAQTQSADGQVANPTPNASDRCDLFTASELSDVLDVEFETARLEPDTAQNTTKCQWTAADQTSLVLTQVIETDGKTFYQQSEDLSRRTLGLVTEVSVPGAQKAFALPNLGRYTMLVGTDLVEVSVLTPTATARQISTLAELAAKRTSR